MADDRLYIEAKLRRTDGKLDGLDRELGLVERLSHNPWHCLPEHGPLGNQGRPRRRIYLEISQFRQVMNATPHVWQTGAEVFE